MSAKLRKRLDRLKYRDPARLTEREREASRLHGSLGLSGAIITVKSARAQSEAISVELEQARFDKDVEQLAALAPARQEERVRDLVKSRRNSLGPVSPKFPG